MFYYVFNLILHFLTPDLNINIEDLLNLDFKSFKIRSLMINNTCIEINLLQIFFFI